MTNKLYEHDLYINNNIEYLFNREIFEYDMKDAGYSLTREYKLLPKKTLDKLDKMKKQYRKVQIGKIQRVDESYKNLLKESFKNARKLFFIANELEEDDVISIKKDAIFTTKRCTITKVGKFIDFRLKHTYTSYIQLPQRLEIYYNGDVDIKGISEECLKLHKDYMVKFIKSYCHKMETKTTEQVLEYVSKFITDYKMKKLDVHYYRTFDHRSSFISNDGEIVFKEYDNSNKENLDISYNFKILLNFIKILL